MAMLGRKPAAPTSPAPAPAQKPQPRAAQTGGEQKTGRIARFRSNLDDIIAELRKVTWPTTEETRNLTIVVIGISGAVALVLWAFDIVLSGAYRFINP